ncbi:MAG: FAD-dependent thymidylate synthase, partial [Actinomycetota bacterium]
LGGIEDRMSVVRAYVGERANRRHKPGRALERVFYRFDVLSDYGAFRDLQRHRMLSIEWQQLSPRHGYTRPEAVDLAGARPRFDEAMERSAALHDALADRFPAQAAYAVSLAYKIRYYLHLNAREAMHLLELRTTPQGHPAYRVVGQEMHRLIAEQAGHRAVAEAMRFVDHSPEPTLERLDAERRAEARRQTR